MSDTILAIREAVNQAYQVYQPLWGETTMPFYLNINAEPTVPAGNKQGKAFPEIHQVDRNQQTLLQCNVTIYYIPDAALWTFVTAHELAHCYQFAEIPNYQLPTYDLQAQGIAWWVEGSAEWMATLVYPDNTAHALSADGYADDFSLHYGDTLTQRSYSNVYFWEYLAQTYGNSAVIDILKNMPAFSVTSSMSQADMLNYMQGALSDPDGTMWGFAQSLMDGTVTYQPAFSSFQLASRQVSGMPASLPVAAPAYGLDYVPVEGFTASTDKKLEIIPHGFADSHERIGLVDSSGAVITLTDEQPLDTCSASTLTFVVSRTDPSMSDPNSSLEFQEVDAAPGECQGELPACIVGTWNVVDLPHIGSVTYQWNPPDFWIKYEKGGIFTGSVLLTTQTQIPNSPNAEAHMSAIIQGNIAVVPGNQPMQYTVTDGNVNMLDFSMEVYLNGNLVSTLHQLPSGSGDVYPVPQVITCMPDNKLQLEVTTGGQTLTWLLSRAQ